MEINNRLFPYPVLSDDTDDYREGRFTVEATIVKKTVSSLQLAFSIKLENPGLQSLINSGRAEFIIHLECAITGFRTIIRTASDEAKCTIQLSKVNERVEVLGMLIAREDIHFYNNIALDRDYDDIDINFKKGSILAYHNVGKLTINKKYEDLSSSNNFFSLCRQDRSSKDEHNQVKYELGDQKIRIIVDDDVYDYYVKIKDNVAMKSMITVALVMPALTYMLETLRSSEHDLDSYQSSVWYIQFDNYYKKNGSSFYDVINGGRMITDIAQELLENPINSLFLNIFGLLEG